MAGYPNRKRARLKAPENVVARYVCEYAIRVSNLFRSELFEIDDFFLGHRGLKHNSTRSRCWSLWNYLPIKWDRWSHANRLALLPTHASWSKVEGMKRAKKREKEISPIFSCGDYSRELAIIHIDSSFGVTVPANSKIEELNKIWSYYSLSGFWALCYMLVQKEKMKKLSADFHAEISRNFSWVDREGLRDGQEEKVLKT